MQYGKIEKDYVLNNPGWNLGDNDFTERIGDIIKVFYIYCPKVAIVCGKMVIDLDEAISNSRLFENIKRFKNKYHDTEIAYLLVIDRCSCVWSGVDYTEEWFGSNNSNRTKKYSIEEWIIKGIIE